MSVLEMCVGVGVGVGVGVVMVVKQLCHLRTQNAGRFQQEPVLLAG
jgi:MFS superfamily sulfate permease-like transporter